MAKKKKKSLQVTAVDRQTASSRGRLRSSAMEDDQLLLGEEETAAVAASSSGRLRSSSMEDGQLLLGEEETAAVSASNSSGCLSCSFMEDDQLLLDEEETAAIAVATPNQSSSLRRSLRSARPSRYNRYLVWEREFKKKDFPYTLLSSFSAEKSQPCSQPQGYT